MLRDCDWSIHFCRRAPASTIQNGSISNAVAYSLRRSEGARSMRARLPSKYLRSATMTSSQSPSFFRSATRYSLTTVNSPDRFDFTNRFWNVGSIDAETPMMLAIVAVGAIAMQLELRMPYRFMRSRRGIQSIDSAMSISTYPPRSSRSSARESWGMIARSHSEPLYDAYRPRSEERRVGKEGRSR